MLETMVNRDRSAGSAAKPYLSANELVALTPWTGEAIRTMVKRRHLEEGTHYFRVGRRLFFKWEAIVGFIEGSGAAPEIPMFRGGGAG